MKLPYKIDLIAGARPNFMKIAPIIRAIQNSPGYSNTIDFRLVHTGQHYDQNMSGQFFKDLGIPDPDLNLEAGGGSQAEQTAKIMVAYERLLIESPCDLCIVVGDVTSTMACSIAAKKLQIKVAHVEAGIRSYDLSMPEEINRMVTDSICDYFFTTTTQASAILLGNGIAPERIFFVGNTMIDTLYSNLNKLREPDFWEEYQLNAKQYLVLTLHRPSNVDEAGSLETLLQVIDHSAMNFQVIFPVHPRTRQILASTIGNYKNLVMVEPMGYLQFNYLVKNSFGVITDSGGITEETTVLGIPCLTLRENTERPETVSIGTNELIGNKPEDVKHAMQRLMSGKWKKGQIPPLWDGKTAERIVEVIEGISKSERL